MRRRNEGTNGGDYPSRWRDYVSLLLKVEALRVIVSVDVHFTGD